MVTTGSWRQEQQEEEQVSPTVARIHSKLLQQERCNDRYYYSAASSLIGNIFSSTNDIGVGTASSWGVDAEEAQEQTHDSHVLSFSSSTYNKRRHTIHEYLSSNSNDNNNESSISNNLLFDDDSKPKQQQQRRRSLSWREPKAPKKKIITKTTNNILLNNRISRCLIDLKAASQHSQMFHDEYFHPSSLLLNHSFSSDHSEESSSSSISTTLSSIRDLVGDVGLALFNPLDMSAFEPLDSSLSSIFRKKNDSLTATTLEEAETYSSSSSSFDNSDIIPFISVIEMIPESDPDILSSCPRLLSQSMMEQLMEALPATVSQTMVWERIFAIGRDGDCFTTFQDKCRSFQHTIIVVEDQGHTIFGAYVGSSWNKQKRREQGDISGSNNSRSFYGSGRSFLFSTADNNNNDDDKLHIYPWTGNNFDFQFCDESKGSIAVGSNSDVPNHDNDDCCYFGLFIQDSFTRGLTAKCSTFHNPPLIPTTTNNNDGREGIPFKITNFEVYGFSSMADAFQRKMKT